MSTAILARRTYSFVPDNVLLLGGAEFRRKIVGANWLRIRIGILVSLPVYDPAQNYNLAGMLIHLGMSSSAGAGVGALSTGNFIGASLLSLAQTQQILTYTANTAYPYYISLKPQAFGKTGSAVTVATAGATNVNWPITGRATKRRFPYVIDITRPSGGSGTYTISFYAYNAVISDWRPDLLQLLVDSISAAPTITGLTTATYLNASAITWSESAGPLDMIDVASYSAAFPLEISAISASISNTDTLAVSIPATFSIIVGVPSPLVATASAGSYLRWYRNSVPLSDSPVYAGTATSTLTITAPDESFSGSFTCVSTYYSVSVTSNACAVTSLNCVTDWANRVVANGGADPSAGTKSALSTFVTGMSSIGVLSLMKAVCCFVPDSLIAAITPLLKAYGNDPWTNANFVTGDLTVAGLRGNGSNKYLNTGVNPSTCFSSTNSGGLTLYSTLNNSATSADFSVFGASSSGFQLLTNYSGAAYFDCFNGGTGRINGTTLTNGLGYFSGNRTGAAAEAIYGASSGSAHHSLASGSGAPGSTFPAYSLPIFCWNNAGSIGSYSSKQFSFAAIHEGLTITQSADFYTLIQALRTSLGGGFV